MTDWNDDSTWAVKKKDRVQYTLKHPVKNGSEEVTELYFRRIKGNDLRGLPLRIDTYDQILELGGQLCGRNSDVMGQLDATDVTQIGGIVLDFFEDGPATGGSA